MNRSRIVTSIAVAGMLTATMLQPRVASAQTPAPAAAPESTQQLAKKLVNPLTDVVSVPFQFNWLNGVGPSEELATLLYIQPVVPMSVSERWNMIGRWVTPYLSQPMAYGGASGIGDVMAQGFFSPKTNGTFLWGIGPMLNLPTTTNPMLGLGKWAAGPTGAIVKTSGAMTYGLLVNNIWSFAGTGQANREDVNMGYFQPVIAHTSKSGVTVVLNTETVANWKAPEGDKISMPVNVAVSKLTKLGLLPMSMQVGAGYYVVRPTNAPSWQLRTTFTLLMPRQR